MLRNPKKIDLCSGENGFIHIYTVLVYTSLSHASKYVSLRERWSVRFDALWFIKLHIIDDDAF